MSKANSKSRLSADLDSILTANEGAGSMPHDSAARLSSGIRMSPKLLDSNLIAHIIPRAGLLDTANGAMTGGCATTGVMNSGIVTP